MKRKRFSEEQIAFALRQAESGTTIEEICRKMGVSEPTFYQSLCRHGRERDPAAEAALRTRTRS